MARDTDRTWEQYGREHPYYGVLSDPKYRGAQLPENLLGEFFDSGEDHIDGVLARVREKLDPEFAPSTALDFGCGVGRLLVPLAKRCDKVTGVDVSTAMLEEARRNCQRVGLQNVEFCPSIEGESAVRGTYDLIHSYIVFQHIPPKRGMKLFTDLLGRLAPGGVGIVHFTFGSRQTLLRRIIYLLRLHLPGVHGIINLVKGRPFGASPMMQMNHYNLNKIMLEIQQIGGTSVYVELTDHGSKIGAILYFQAG